MTSLYDIVQGVSHAYTGIAFAITVFSGLLTIMVERFLYARRGYKREAGITAVIGWTYIVGGTCVYLLVWVLKQMG